MSIHCLRWGRSAYEKQEDFEQEAEQLKVLNVHTTHDAQEAPDLEDISILVVHSKKQVTKEIFAQAKQLKLVITTTSGYDHIDLEAAYAQGVRVARSPLARRDAVIETTLAMSLSLLRDLPYFQMRAHEGDWARAKLPNRPISLLSNLQVGIVGYGVIGQKAAQIWQALGAKVEYSDPAYPNGSVPLKELVQSSQLLTLHCALNPSTNKLIGQEVLQSMPKGAILLNTARGRCVDIDALLEATHLGGVGLDVFPEEPCPRLQQLAALPNFWVTPHAAGYHQTLGQSITQEVVATVKAWLAEETLPNEIHLPTLSHT